MCDIKFWRLMAIALMGGFLYCVFTGASEPITAAYFVSGFVCRAGADILAAIKKPSDSLDET